MKIESVLFFMFGIFIFSSYASANNIQPAQNSHLQEIQQLQQNFNNLKNDFYDKTMQNVNLALQGANRATGLVSSFALIFTVLTVALGLFGIKELASIRSVRLDAENTLKLTKHFSLGNTYVQASLFPEAIKEFIKVIEIDKNNDIAHTQLGFLFMSLQQPDIVKSKFHSKRATEINSNNYTAYLNLGVVMDRSGERKEDSLSVYSKGEGIALNEMADDITIGKFKLFAGHCYKDLGKKPEAKIKYDEARPYFMNNLGSQIPQIAILAKRWLDELNGSYMFVSI